MNRNRLLFWLRIFAIITAVGAYVMLLLGALVTGTGSGQGCGNSWPFCQDQVIPMAPTMAAIIEYSHRTMSGLDGFLILVLTVASFLLYRRDYRIKLFGFLSLFFVVLQGVLGALTVVYEGTFAKFPLLSLHFGFSLISFASVLLLVIRLFQLRERHEGSAKREPAPVLSRAWQFGIWALTAYIYLVIYTGALVRHTNSTTGCGAEIPLCGSTYLPNLSSPAGIQMLHRYAAGSIWLLLLVLLIAALRSARGRRDIVLGSWAALILATLQAIVGMLIVVSGGLLSWSLLHTTLVSILFAVLSYLCMQVGWPWQKQRKISGTTSEEKAEGLHAALP